MNHSMKYDLIMSQLTHIEDVKETEKTKISIVFHQNRQVLCRLRICKNRDLSSLCAVLQNLRNPNLLLVHDYVYENGKWDDVRSYVGKAEVVSVYKGNHSFYAINVKAWVET